MKKTIKIISFLLIITLLTLTAVSCNNPDNGGNGSTTENKSDNNDDGSGDIQDSSGSEEPQKDKPVDVRDILETLPDADYEGYVFRIWTSNSFNADLEARQAPEEEQNADLINDALWTRDKLIEEKYNIEIKYEIFSGDDPAGGVYNAANKSIAADDDAFDFAMDKMIVVAKQLAQKGMLVDFNSIPNIDLSNEWWSKYAIRDLTINGRFFFPTGDITARYPGSQYLMMFNKKLFGDLSLDYPYQSVLDGNWTLDEMFKLTKSGTFDLNGDSVLSKDDDRFGLVVETMAPFCFLHAGGQGLTKIVDGNPVFNVKNDKTIAIMDKLASVWSDPDYFYYPPNYVTYDEVPIFKQDRALFAAMTGTNASFFKDMVSDFGIVPLPKYDATQTEYYSYCQPYGSAAVCVPVTTENIERTGMIIEAMAAGGKYTSTPAAYDLTFKIKYARDEESSQMLDIILDGSVYDFAFIYDWGTIYSSFNTAISKGDSYLTKFESIEGRAQTAMDKTIDIFSSAE